jgi:hypothetical protein
MTGSLVQYNIKCWPRSCMQHPAEPISKPQNLRTHHRVHASPTSLRIPYTRTQRISQHLTSNPGMQHPLPIHQIIPQNLRNVLEGSLGQSPRRTQYSHHGYGSPPPYPACLVCRLGPLPTEEMIIKTGGCMQNMEGNVDGKALNRLYIPQSIPHRPRHWISAEAPTPRTSQIQPEQNRHWPAIATAIPTVCTGLSPGRGYSYCQADDWSAVLARLGLPDARISRFRQVRLRSEERGSHLLSFKYDLASLQQ